MVRLDPYKSKEVLGSLYDELYKAKKKFNPETNFAEIHGSEKAYECRVLHDANCLSFLQCNVNTPLDAKNVFVTSDFRLGKIRRQFPTQYEFVLNVLEFYEFILPYLFMSGLIEGNPVEAPNLLLASALSAELNQEEEFDARLKSVLLSEEEIHHQYEILASGACKERLLNVRQRMSKYSEVKSDAEKAKCFDDFSSLTGELLRVYMSEIKSSTAKELTSLKISEDSKEIERMKSEIETLKKENAKLLIKKRRRDKYGKK